MKKPPICTRVFVLCMTLVMRIVRIVENWTSAQIVASINMEHEFIRYIILTLHMMQPILQSLLWGRI